MTLHLIFSLDYYIIWLGQPESRMIKHREGIEELSFLRGTSGIVDNPISSYRRGKTLSWQLAMLCNVAQTISRGMKDD